MLPSQKLLYAILCGFENDKVQEKGEGKKNSGQIVFC